MFQESEKQLQRDAFERSVEKFAEKFRNLQAANKELEQILKEKEESIQTLNRQQKELQQKYNQLKNAQVLTVAGYDIDAAKRQIAGLIREVDHCIKLINI